MGQGKTTENISAVVVLVRRQGRYWLSLLALLHSGMILCMRVSQRGLLLVFDIYRIVGILLF